MRSLLLLCGRQEQLLLRRPDPQCVAVRHDEDGDEKKSAVASEVHWQEWQAATAAAMTAGIGDEQRGQRREEEIRADELQQDNISYASSIT